MRCPKVITAFRSRISFFKTPVFSFDKTAYLDPFKPSCILAVLEENKYELKQKMMVKKISLVAVGILFITALSSFSSVTTIDKGWERIGSKKVNFKLDRDVIPVGLEDGRFTKLKVLVTRGGLNMHKMVVHYGNGAKDQIALRHNFGKKSTSRVIDLKGNKRYIKKITFIYDTKNYSKQRAKLHVFGKK